MNASLTSWAGDVLRQGLKPSGPTLGPARNPIELRGDDCFASALQSTAMDHLRDATIDIAARSLNYPQSALDFVLAAQDVLTYEAEGDLEGRLKQLSVMAEAGLALDPRLRAIGVGLEIGRALADFRKEVNECEKRWIDRIYERAEESQIQAPEVRSERRLREP